MSEQIEKRPVWMAVAGAAVAASAILVFAILPAEYGVDPTRVGGALGLTALSEDQGNVLKSSDVAFRHLERTFPLEAFESFEYKLTLAEDAGMVFSWEATGPVEFDFHAEPDDEGLSEASFDIGSAGSRRGTFVAPFSGIHGWYWENRGLEPVTVTLKAEGFFTEATEYRGGFPTKQPIPED